MIAGVVALAFFAVVLLVVALVERSIRRAREEQAAWAAFAERIRPAMVALGSSVAAFGVTFAEAAKAAADFSRSLRQVEDVFASSADDIARLRADASRLSSETTT